MIQMKGQEKLCIPKIAPGIAGKACPKVLIVGFKA